MGIKNKGGIGQMSKDELIYHVTSALIASGPWTELDRIYLQNRLLGLVGETSFQTPSNLVQTAFNQAELLSQLDELINIAIANEVIENNQSARDILESQIMDLMTPAPSVVNETFTGYYNEDPKKATDYFYDLSQRNNYIKTRQIEKNIRYTYPSVYGNLEITINLSKPEKDPKQIALEKNTPKSHYPKCLLCMENEGYEGHITHPARTNHRIIRLDLAGDLWGMQYSPYAYYDEHAIFLSSQHRPMAINRRCFEHLLQIVDILPHYFVGSNADLPIVGGSILSHDHFQGGGHTFAMAEAPIETEFTLKEYPEIQAGIVKWPMSVIRLTSESKEQLVDASVYVLKQWQEYSQPELDIVAETADGVKHHTITPIARKRGTSYELDLVLRDNNVSETYPDGIFHPHPEVQHIKKENIGLIEVMGLAILPPRLKDELQEVSAYLLGKDNEIADYHIAWAQQIKDKHSEINEESVDKLVLQEVGVVFEQVLHDAGVFKRDTEGQQAFQAFVATL